MAKCAHCGASDARNSWDLSPCALGHKLKAKLCDPCDAALNSLILAFFGVTGRKALVRRYRRSA